MANEPNNDEDEWDYASALKTIISAYGGLPAPPKVQMKCVGERIFEDIAPPHAESVAQRKTLFQDLLHPSELAEMNHRRVGWERTLYPVNYQQVVGSHYIAEKNLLCIHYLQMRRVFAVWERKREKGT